jgi:osmotically-inducible protein OsmY
MHRRYGSAYATKLSGGGVRSEAERDAAGWDAWYVFGVDDVINEIEIGA